MREKKIEKVAELFNFLGDPTRLKILDLLMCGQEMCVKEIAEKVDVSRSAISHQLAKLEANEVVVARRDGQTICYQLEKNRITRAIKNALAAM